MPASVDPAVLALCRRLATDLGDQGAVAVIVAGSHVRGEAHRESDVDLHALGGGPHYTLLHRAGYLLSISWHEPEEARAQLYDPATAGAVVPGWREAVILLDRDGAAAGLQAEAQSWTWAAVGDDTCNAYVADAITGWAEEVHKLGAALDRGDVWMAAAQRSLIACGLPVRLSVHLRLLYGSENVVWRQVADRLGEPWADLQGRALGVGGESFKETCGAALQLYIEAARLAGPLLNEEQRLVVEHACALARGTSASNQ